MFEFGNMRKFIFVASTTYFLCGIFCHNNEIHRDAYWDEWGSWSNCSRPCGGGVTQQTRECIKVSNETNSTCFGTQVQYRMCNIQDCPDGTPGFRMQQCSKYNEIEYKGKYFEWADFAHNAGECELKCMPKKEFFYVTFQDKVIDGTRCNKFSLDVCINGTCQHVGCDNQLYSDAKVDVCGVCRGDNTTCYPVQQVFSVPKDAYGYVDITTIPQGASSIKIKEIGKPTLYLAMQTNNKNVLNGNYIFSNPQKRKYDNNILIYQRDKEINQILIDGPIEVPLQVKAFIMDGVNNVSFQYSVPNSYSTKQQPAQYIYIMSAWGKCSKECAGGERKRNVFCANKVTRAKVPSFYCKQHRPRIIEKCNTQPCPSRWYISQWAACSQTCGRGLRTRRVHCVRTQQDGNIEMLDDEKCSGDVPIRTENCVDQGTCPKWTIKRWSKCSKTCGEGVEERQVECMNMEDNSVEEFKCSIENKPITVRPCFNAPCGAIWKFGEWGECSSECGHGLRSRSVTCWNDEGIEVPLHFCNAATEPEHFIDCENSGPCKPQWKAGMWSKCSAKCGKGKQMRAIVCTVLLPDFNRLQVLENSRCNATEKPIQTRRCKNPIPCRIMYHVSGWGQCSVTCGEGMIKRTVRCFSDESIDYTERSCSNIVRPLDHKICYQPKCGESRDVSTTTTPQPKKSTPKIVITGQKIIHVGENVDYICKVSGHPKPYVSWQMNGQLLSSSKSRFQQIERYDGSNLIITQVHRNDSGTLSCRANNSIGIAQEQIHIDVYLRPTTSFKENLVYRNVGENYILTCDVGGYPSPRIQWHKNNEKLQSDGHRVLQNGTSVIFKPILLKDEGIYRCFASNSAGDSTESMELKVRPTDGKTDKTKSHCKDDERTDCSLASRTGLCGYPRFQSLCCKSCKSFIK